MSNIALFPRRLRDMRKEKGFTRKQLAKEINASDKAIMYWELSKSLPSAILLLSLAEALHVSVDWLLGRDSS